MVVREKLIAVVLSSQAFIVVGVALDRWWSFEISSYLAMLTFVVVCAGLIVVVSMILMLIDRAKNGVEIRLPAIVYQANVVTLLIYGWIVASVVYGLAVFVLRNMRDEKARADG